MAQKKVTLKDVVLHYAFINVPALKYEEKIDPDDFLANKEYVVDACIKASEFKAMKRSYSGMGVKSLKEVEGITADKYTASYQVEPPADFEDEDGLYYVLKFRAFTKYPSGDPCPVPSVFGIVGRTQDRKGNEIAQDTSIGNGTRAFLQYGERTYSYKGKSGIALDLKGVAITELVPYVSNSGANFDFEEGAVNEDDPFGDGSADDQVQNQQQDDGPDDEWG